MITFITGGARSGKSRHAQELAISLSSDPIYIATARDWGGDFSSRIKRHQQSRGPEWTSFEAEKKVSLLPIGGRVAVIDCVTLWLTNFFVEYKNDIDLSLAAFQAEINTLTQMDGHFIIVSNEIGMGVHAETETGRKFTDLQGWANQYVAAKAENVVLMISGIALPVKSR